MPIRDVQPRLRQIIRIRMGQKVAAKKEGETRPQALTTWRLTSPHRAPIDRAAELWGGVVEEMADPLSADRWEVVTEVSALPCAIPPVAGFNQWYETWSKGGCQRRCDGVRELLSDEDCLCGPDPDERVCKPTTRLTVVLTDIDELAGARLESHGYNAAAELAFAEALYAAARERHTLIPAELRIVPRTARRDGKTSHFVVPELAVRMGATLEALGMAGVPRRALEEAAAAVALPPPDPWFGPDPKPVEISPPPAASPTREPAPAGEAPAAEARGDDKRSVWEELLESARVLIGEDQDCMTFFGLVTGGRSHRPEHLNEPEQAGARQLLTAIERRKLEIDFKAEGGPCFMRLPGGEHVWVHYSRSGISLEGTPPAPAWRELARAAGVNWSAFLRRAKDEAAALGIDAPTKADQVTDPDLIAVMSTWLDEQANAKAPA